MDSDDLVFSTLSEVGIPGTRSAWQLGKAPPLPWFVYLRANGGEFFADNDTTEPLPRYRAELYIRENDPDLVRAFEEAVRRLGTFRHRQSWLAEENCQMHSYTFTLTKKGA